MSNRYSIYTWESVSQQILDKWAAFDGLPKRARHKWMHLCQAKRLLGMSEQQIYQEGYRDFLIVRTNDFYYNWQHDHLDGIIHPSNVLIHMQRMMTEKSRRSFLKEFAKDGFPTEMEEVLVTETLFSDPEAFHKAVRSSYRAASKIQRKGSRLNLDASVLPKTWFNGYELRQQGLWFDEQLKDETPASSEAPGEISEARDMLNPYSEAKVFQEGNTALKTHDALKLDIKNPGYTVAETVSESLGNSKPENLENSDKNADSNEVNQSIDLKPIDEL